MLLSLFCYAKRIRAWALHLHTALKQNQERKKIISIFFVIKQFERNREKETSQNQRTAKAKKRVQQANFLLSDGFKMTKHTVTKHNFDSLFYNILCNHRVHAIFFFAQ